MMVTSDNGFHLGQFGMIDGKRLIYETDIRVPLAVRGPGVRRGVVDARPVVAAIDLAPTLLEIAGASLPHHQDGEERHDMDGTSFLHLLEEGDKEQVGGVELL